MIPVAITGTKLAPTSTGDLAKIQAVQDVLMQLDQVDLQTQHVIHGGMYARTIKMPPGSMLTGALIKLATILIFSGRAKVYTGNEWVELVGYHVLPASAGRKQVFFFHEETTLTMIFPSKAETVDQAEQEFTDEADLLLSRRQDNQDIVIITGE